MAGLLDYLFDPSTYSAQGGGLLSRLQPSLVNVPQSQGFPDQPTSPEPRANPLPIGPNYAMPRVGNPNMFDPQQVNLPQNAQPAQGQMVPQQSMPPSFSQPAGGFFDRLNAGLQSIGNGGSVIGALTGNRTDPQTISQQNQRALFEAYRGAGLSPSQAMVAVLNPTTAKDMMGGGQTDDIKEYQFAKREDPTLTFQKFMQQKKAVTGEYSLNPVYGTDDKGNAVLMQTGKSGEAIRTKLPEGVKVSSGIEKVDLGTHWALYDKKSGVSLGTQPKDLQGKEAAEERGKVQGQAQAALPGAIADAEATKTKIDELLKSEGLNSIVGPLDQFRPSWLLGESGRDALARYKQLQGQAFLQAYGLLRGGGAITDIEGKKAESAMVRMDRAQSEDDFKTALKDFRDAIDIGVRKLRDRASGGSSPAGSAAPPQRIKLNADGTIAQ